MTFFLTQAAMVGIRVSLIVANNEGDSTGSLMVSLINSLNPDKSCKALRTLSTVSADEGKEN